MDENTSISSTKHNLFISLLKCIALSFPLALITGLIGGAFSLATLGVTSLRLSHPEILFLLPIGAVIITFVYHISGIVDSGVFRVINCIDNDEELPLRIAPLIFFSATLSHLCGASVGRVGTSLQLGGTIGNSLSLLLSLSKGEREVIMLCGMSGVFSAFFGTPFTGTILAIEIISIKRHLIKAIIPCAITSFLARAVSSFMGVKNPSFKLYALPDLNIKIIVLIVFCSVLCGVLSMLYYRSLSEAKVRFSELISNPYIKGFVGGCLLLFITYCFGMDTQDYNGIGADIISRSIQGEINDLSFLWKLLFTAFSVGIGYKGGEVYPAIFIGASFGSFFGNMIGISPAFFAAIGVVALFNGILKCPIASLLLSIEFFGFDGTILFAIAIMISLVTSGKGGIYRSII